MLSKNTNLLTNREIPILTYHSFEASSWKYSLEPTLFDEHLDYLTSKGYVSLTLSEYTQQDGLALSTKPFILTFNGGFKSLERILPILRKYHCKATYFVPTAYVGKQSHWLNNQGHIFTQLDWEALIALNQMGMEIGSHGHEHHQLDVIPEVLARHDISYSKVLIEDKIGQACSSFAYPYGYQNIQIKKLVRTAGFSLACTMDDRISTSESDLYSLPRLSMNSTLSAKDLKNLLRQKDSGVLTPYALVKSSVSRQLRRWNTPLQEVKITTEDLEPKAPIQERELQTWINPAQSDPQVILNQLDSTEAAYSLFHNEPLPAIETTLQATEAPILEEDFLCSTETTLQVAEAPTFKNDLLGSTERHPFEFQGEYLASRKAVLRSYPHYHLEEYKHLACALALLEEAQENNLLFDHFEDLQQTYHDFEQAVTHQVKDKIQQQKDDIQQHLQNLSQLPNNLLHTSAERIKNILEHHLATLRTQALNDLELLSANSLIINYKQRLHQSYRQELMRLLQKATNVNALETLRDIQQAMRMLEQDQFPNLEALEQALKDKLAQDKYAKFNQKKTQKFNQNLQSLLSSFENISIINNENMYSVSSTIQYLKEQQPHFSQLSSLLQDELIFSLKNAQKRLQSLIKESKATTEVALDILTSNALDKAFSIFDHPQTDTPVVFAQDSSIGVEFKN